MYLVAKDNNQVFTSLHFHEIPQFCIQNRCTRLGLRGASLLKEGVEIYKITNAGVVLVKSYKDNERSGLKTWQSNA